MAARRAPRGALLAAALLCACASVASALYSGGAVVSVTDTDYKSKLKGLALLELYAPCVPHSAAAARRARTQAQSQAPAAQRGGDNRMIRAARVR